MRKLLSLFFILSFSLSTFAKVPQWVKNPSKIYSPKDFFTAVGNGKTQQQAELSAIENLAAIFGRNVSSSSKTSSRMQQAEENGTVSIGMSADFSKDIMQKVAVEDLIGIELKEYYNDEKKFYALAVMDKKNAENILSSSIKVNNSRIEKLLCSSKPSELYTMETYARFDFAREIAQLDEKFLSKLEVINVKVAEDLKKQIYTGASIRSQLLDIAKGIPISVKVNGDDDNKIKHAISEMFGDFGFRVTDLTKTRYTFYAHTEKTVREADYKKIVQCIYSFEGQLKDENEMEYLWSCSFSGRESSTSMDLLPSRTQRAMYNKIKNDCSKSFEKFLTNMKTE